MKEFRDKFTRLSLFRFIFLVFPTPQDMRKGDIRPNVFSFSAAASACAKTGDWERALGLLREMRDRDGLAPTEFHYTAAVRGKLGGSRKSRKKWRPSETFRPMVHSSAVGGFAQQA